MPVSTTAATTDMTVRRSTGALAVLLGSVGIGAVTACDPSWEDPLPVRVAVRADGSDGSDVEVWTGRPCRGVTKVEVLYDTGRADPVVVTYRSRKPRAVERWSLDAPPPGFRGHDVAPDAPVTEDDEVLIRMDGPGGQRSVTVDLAPLEDAEDADGSDYLLGKDWVDEDDVLAGDGEDYELLCGSASSDGS